MNRIGAQPLALALALAAATGAQADIDDHLERDWYYVETLFFRHAAPPNDEDFSRQAPPRHRLRLASLQPPPAAYAERIAANPPEPHDFPRLQQFDCIAPTPAPWMQADDHVESLAVPEAAPSEAVPRADDQPPIAATAPIPTGPPAPGPEQRARWAIEDFERRLLREGWQWRYDELSLATAASRMRRSGDYDVLHHGRWLQAVPPRDSATPLLLQLGPEMPDATFELEGSVSVTLGRFLHFAAHLWLQQAPTEARAAPDLARASEPNGGPEVSVDARGPTTDAVDRVLLSESRRMRPGELHYLDHPWLGILVRIEPVQAPATLAALAESLGDKRGLNR